MIKVIKINARFIRRQRFDKKKNYYEIDSSFLQCIIEESEKKNEANLNWIKKWKNEWNSALTHCIKK